VRKLFGTFEKRAPGTNHFVVPGCAKGTKTVAKETTLLCPLLLMIEGSRKLRLQRFCIRIEQRRSIEAVVGRISVFFIMLVTFRSLSMFRESYTRNDGSVFGNNIVLILNILKLDIRP